jgi:hypothetical protein
MTVYFNRVLGIRSKEPSILATVDGNSVRWNSRRGWRCSCPSVATASACVHVDVVRSLLAPDVLAPLTLTR